MKRNTLNNKMAYIAQHGSIQIITDEKAWRELEYIKQWDCELDEDYPARLAEALELFKKHGAFFVFTAYAPDDCWSANIYQYRPASEFNEFATIVYMTLNED